jgi:DNA modification methylase
MDIDVFMQRLRDENLCIAPVDLVQNYTRSKVLEQKQKEALRKNWLSYSDILKLGLLDYSSRSGLIAALKKKCKPGEIKNIRGTWKVLATAIKRIRDESIVL